ncbi:MAG: Cof-type HAD-IIB family hydrolase [Oscillospiraceae bacterium]|nr:Cof-type HAD-IIB family hydrolase [Oscillospiraceae bacterium]
MGKFEKMLLLSDYDNTMCYTESALNGGEAPAIHPRNLEAIRYWIAEGGTFAMATGRALGAFRTAAEGIPMNAPAIVDNGAAIYDLKEERYLVESCLPDVCLEHLAAIVQKFPEVSLELYHPDDLIQIVHLVEWNKQHAKLTNMGYEVIPEVTPRLIKLPLVKALIVAEMELLKQIYTYMEEMGWASEYELIFSSSHLLEMTARGADKGQMALKLKELCGCDKLYCAGDHANDLPMLRAADRAFAPSNAIPAVLESGAAVVCHCIDGALGDIVEILDRE